MDHYEIVYPMVFVFAMLFLVAAFLMNLRLAFGQEKKSHAGLAGVCLAMLTTGVLGQMYYPQNFSGWFTILLVLMMVIELFSFIIETGERRRAGKKVTARDMLTIAFAAIIILMSFLLFGAPVFNSGLL